MSDFTLELQTVKTLVEPDTYAYILDKLKLKDKPAQKVTFFQILSKLDSLEAARILLVHGKQDAAFRTVVTYVTFHADRVYCDHGSGMDCYLEPAERRDAQIKQWIKKAA